MDFFKLSLLGVSLAAGAVISLQVGVNSALREKLPHPMQATLVSFFTGGVAALLYCLILRPRLPDRQLLAQQPWWIWSGGLLGLFYVWSTVVIAPRVGVSLMLAFTVAGQLLAALVIDHFGWFQAAAIPVSMGRMLGALIVVAGATILLLAK